MFSSIKWTIFNLFIYIILVHGEITNTKICANEECTEPISHAKTLIKYVSSKRGVMSFGLSEDVIVYSKYKGEKNDLWTVEINGRKGDVPKRFLRENRIVAKNTIELPLTTSDETASLTSKDEGTPSVNEIEKKSDALKEKSPAEVEINSKDESNSEDNLMKELSPSRVLKQTSVELDPSITLDNVVEYTGQKVNLASEPMQSSAWFPETPSVVETSLDDISRSSELNGDSNLLPSLTAEESTPVKYLIIDGTSIIDEEPESSVPVQEQLKSKQVEDFDYQLTSTQIESSVGQIFSSAVEYFPSASSSSLLESSSVSNLNTRSDEISIEKESENGQDKSKEENNSGGWFNGISDFFSVDEVENTEINTDAASAIPDELSVGATESTKIVEESNLNSMKESESDKNIEKNKIADEQNKISDEQNKIVDEQNKISGDSENEVVDKVKEVDDGDDSDEESYSSRSLLSKEEELDEDDDDDDTSNDDIENETKEDNLENTTVEDVDLQSENSSDAVNLEEQVNNMPSIVTETNNTSDSSLKFFETKTNAEVNEKSEKEEQFFIDNKSLPEVVMGDKEENIVLNDNNSKEKEEINNKSSVKSKEADIFLAKELEERMDDDRTLIETSEEKVEDDVASVKSSEEEKSENESASNKSLDEKIEYDSASNKSLDEKIDNTSASNKSLDEKIESDLHNEEILSGIERVVEETVNDGEDIHENKVLSDKFDEQNVDEAALASKFIPISDDQKELDPLIFEDDSSSTNEYNHDHESSELKNSIEKMASLNSDNVHSDNQQHAFTESNLDNCDVNEEGYCIGKAESDVPEKERYFESQIDEEDTQYSFADQFKYFLDMILKWLPDHILEYLHELEVLGVSPKVVTLTVIVGIFVFILEISYLALKKGFKEKSYLTKLGSLDQKLFSAITERDELKQELTALKQITENSYEEFSDSQKIIDEIQQELDYSRNICEKLQADNATLQEQLNTATDVGTDLNQMLSEFLTSQTSNVKLQDAVTGLQDQLESQQNIINGLQLQEETTKQINLQNKEELEKLKFEKVTLETLIEELTTSQKDLLLAKDNLAVENDTKTQQIDYLKQNNAQLLKESEEWDQSVQQLQLTINTYQSQIQDLTEELSVKSNELTMAKDFLAKLKFSKNSTNAEDDTNEEALVVNADVILQQMSDVSNVKAELSAIKEERDVFKEQLLTEREARTAAEESIKGYSTENHNLQIEYNKAHQERVEAKTKLDVLSNYFKDKEMQLQKELGLQEAMRQQSQENVSSVTHRIATYEQEADLNRLQLSTLKTEIENQEKSFRSQLMVQEKKAHENWIAARVAERKLEQIKQESAILRNKLTLLEQEKKEYMDDKLNAKKLNNSNNGEVVPTQNTLQPEDRSSSMDLPTSGSSSLFREPLAGDPRFPFLPIDRPLPPPIVPMPPFLHPMQMMPPPPHLMSMNHPVPLMPPHFMGPRRGLPPMDMWMADRPRQSPPFDHPINRERRTPPAYAQQRSPPPYEERLSSPSTISGDRRGDENYSRDGYREQTPPSRYSDQSGPPSNTDNIPPHLRRYKLDNGSVNSRKPSPVVKRNYDNPPSV